MLRIAGQTTGPIGLIFLWTLRGGRGVLKAEKSIFFQNKIKISRATPGLSASV